MYQEVESPSRRIQAIWTSLIRVIDEEARVLRDLELLAGVLD